MKKEFCVEEKLEAISYVFQGESARSVSDRLHLGHHLLYEWLDAYRSKGIPGLKPKKKGRSKLPYEERCKIVREYHERELTLHQLSVKYNISESAICTWAKLVERNGFEALHPISPGLPKHMSVWSSDFQKKSTRRRTSVFARRTNA